MEIENITSTFVTLFKLDLNMISKKKMKITELIPDFQNNLNEYLSK